MVNHWLTSDEPLSKFGDRHVALSNSRKRVCLVAYLLILLRKLQTPAHVSECHGFGAFETGSLAVQGKYRSLAQAEDRECPSVWGPFCLKWHVVRCRLVLAVYETR